MFLEAPNATAHIDLDGGKLASLVVHGHEILVTEGEKVTRWGSFPMAPWAGRLAHGRLRFDGSEHHFELTSPPHANHGTVLRRTWDQIADDTIETDFGPEWPFGGRVRQTFTLSESQLTVRMDIFGATQPMPLLVGWHPWFRRELGAGGPAKLDFDAAAAYSVDDELIPTGHTEPVPAGRLNHCVTGLAGNPTITWPGALTVEIDSSLDHWVIFTEPDHALCVEPQSGPPNQPNTEPFVLHPDEAVDASMTISWRHQPR